MAELDGENLKSNKIKITFDETVDQIVDQTVDESVGQTNDTHKTLERNLLNNLSEENEESDSRYFLSEDFVSVCR